MYFLHLFDRKDIEKSNTLQTFLVNLCKEMKRLRTQRFYYITKWKKDGRKGKEKRKKSERKTEEKRKSDERKAKEWWKKSERVMKEKRKSDERKGKEWWKKSERVTKEKGIKKAGTPKDSRYYFGLKNLED